MCSRGWFLPDRHAYRYGASRTEPLLNLIAEDACQVVSERAGETIPSRTSIWVAKIPLQRVKTCATTAPDQELRGAHPAGYQLKIILEPMFHSCSVCRFTKCSLWECLPWINQHLDVVQRRVVVVATGARNSMSVPKRCSLKHCEKILSHLTASQLKCDESKPYCGRCTRLGVQCPGFSRPLKWSTEHEKHGKAILDDASKMVEPLDDVFAASLSTPNAGDCAFASFLHPAFVSGIKTVAQQGDEEMDFDAMLRNVNDDPRGEWLLQLSPTAHDISRPTALSQSQQGIDGFRRTSRTLQSLITARKSDIPKSIVDESSELLQYYFKEVPQMVRITKYASLTDTLTNSQFAVYDSQKNPFRATVSSLFSQSLAINYIAQSMAAACLIEVHPRFGKVGQTLRSNAMDLLQRETKLDYKSMLALLMLGGTTSWHDNRNLGIECFNLVRRRLHEIAESGDLMPNDNNFLFFHEALVYWEMLLVYATDAKDLLEVDGQEFDLHEMHPFRRVPHPWTGVARDTIKTVQKVGRLVRAQRTRAKGPAFTTMASIDQWKKALAEARALEEALLNAEHLKEDEVLNPEDSVTPVWHLTSLAEVYRLVGLIQIYKVFPDLLSERLAVDEPFDIATDDQWLSELGQIPRANTATRNAGWLTSLALEALGLLEKLSLDSGTRDFQPFLLVACSSELVCPDPGENGGGLNSPSSFSEVSAKRKFVLDRLASFLRILPPKPIRVCLGLVKETWRRMDDGEKSVYWMDVMIANGWHCVV
jgi:hypothetical protein